MISLRTFGLILALPFLVVVGLAAYHLLIGIAFENAVLGLLVAILLVVTVK